MESLQVEKFSLNKVPSGISLVFYGLELTALALILSIFLPFVAENNFAFALQALFWLNILIVVAGFLSFIGKILCATAPESVTGREIVYVAVILNVVAVLFSAAGLFLVMPSGSDPVLSMIVITEYVCFLLFLRNLALFLKDDELARNCTSLMGLGIALVVAIGALVGSVFLVPDAVVFTALVTFVLGVLALVRYSRLLHKFKAKLK